ncbi:hypothetical protein GCM10022225_16580 [Plantactinospora mayteni]|uniref:Uncharacterized protein n=1 Tax=Plantactinospora mayteni TaxID=566021 RepID=A0ABQ4EG73_9ACTN|nr:hypothetical protein Pma05_03050 [Plantactinospora mayteni]
MRHDIAYPIRYAIPRKGWTGRPVHGNRDGNRNRDGNDDGNDDRDGNEATTTATKQRQWQGKGNGNRGISSMAGSARQGAHRRLAWVRHWRAYGSST